MSHVTKFKVLYLTLMISIASAIVGELGPLKEMTPQEIHALTWVFWVCTFFNVVISGGTAIVAALSNPPPPSNVPASELPTPPTGKPAT